MSTIGRLSVAREDESHLNRGQSPQRDVAQGFERLSYKQQREGSIPSMPTWRLRLA